MVSPFSFVSIQFLSVPPVRQAGYSARSVYLETGTGSVVMGFPIEFQD